MAEISDNDTGFYEPNNDVMGTLQFCLDSYYAFGFALELYTNCKLYKRKSWNEPAHLLRK